MHKKFHQSHFITTVNELLQYFSLADLLPYRFFDPTYKIFINNQSVSVLWRIEPLIGFDEQSYKSLCSLFQTIMPMGSSLQCSLIASPHIHHHVDPWVAHHMQSPFQYIAHERERFLYEHFQGFARNFVIALSFSIPSNMFKTPAQTEAFLHTTDQIQSLLRSLGCTITRGDPHFLHYVIANMAIFSFTRLTPFTWKKAQPLHTQCIPAGYRMTINDNILYGHHHDTTMAARLYTTTDFPDQWSSQAMSCLLGAEDNNLLQINCPFFISYGIHLPTEHTLRSRIMAKCAQVEKQAHSPLARWIPSLHKEAQEWTYVRAQCEKGQRIVRTRMQVGLWGFPNTITQQETTLMTLFKHHHFSLERDTFIMLPSLISSLPMTWSEGIAQDNKRFCTMKTTLSHEPPLLMPLQGDWKGTSSRGVMLMSRRGQLATWSPFDNTMGNYNVCVIGRSGSGKSVFMQEIARTTISQGGRVFVVDVGRSFEKVGRLLQAHYIAFDTQKPISLNPFSHISKDKFELLSLIKPILCTMASPSNTLQDIEVALLDKALHHTWKQCHEHTTITHIAQTLANDGTSIAQQLSDKLFPYTEAGPYGAFFHGPSVPLDTQRFIIIEMEELKERKDLQAVLVQVIINCITSTLYCGDRSTRTHIILDEAWDLLRGGASAHFIETAARRLRKYQGSLIVGTQSPHDFFQSAGAQAAFDNSDWVCFLSQKSNALHSLKQSGKMSLSPHLEESISSLHTLQGSYAEILIHGPNGYAINRLILDKFSQMLFTTKPEEFAFIQNLVNTGTPLVDALKKALEKFQ